jgi:hypothetical protein
MTEARSKRDLAELARAKARQATDERLRALYEQMAADWEAQANGAKSEPFDGDAGRYGCRD